MAHHLVNIITMKSAHEHLLQTQGKKKTDSIKLGDLQTLCMRTKSDKKPKKHWSFTGDWKTSVAPYYY